MTSQKDLSSQFLADFRSRRADIDRRLDESEAQFSQATSYALHGDIASLRRGLTDATAFISAYDQRQLELQLKNLEQRLSDIRQAAAPKPRFGFRRKKGAVDNSSALAPSAAVAPDHLPNPVQAEPPSTPNSSSVHHTLSNASSRCLTISSISSTSPVDITLSDLQSCVVNLVRSDHGVTVGSIHARHLRNTVLLAPIFSGSIILDNCQHCIVVAGCHQFRMHTSSNVDVFLHASSTPIIEHCTVIRVGPFLLPTSEDLSASKHLEFQDFDWLRSTPSPNWTVLRDENVQIARDKIQSLSRVDEGDLDKESMAALAAL